MNAKPLPSCALVITTYNWPSALEKVLQSLECQTIKPQQILVADDGSNTETTNLLSRYQSTLPQMVHCWQPDKGFRLARSRNNALAKVTSDYVIMIDGDMVLEPHFIEDHLHYAKNNSFVQGRRVMLTPEATTKLLNQSDFHWDINALKKQVLTPYKLTRSAVLARLLNYKQRNANDIRGCNMGFWMSDLEAVNGFDSDYIGWGREDSDIGWRLIKTGLCKRHLRYKAIALHLHHNEQSRESLSENNQRLLRSRHELNYIRCTNGLNEISTSNSC